MSPILLGILGQGVAGAVAAGSFESIATVSLSSSNSIIEFTSIPDTYKNLQLRVYSPSGSYGIIRFNNDTTTSNYRNHFIVATGSGNPGVGSNANQAYFPEPGSWSSPFGAVLDIVDYSSSTKYKVTRTLEGFDANGSGEVYFYSNLWMSSNAITSIKITAQGANFGINTHAAIYGIKDS